MGRTLQYQAQGPGGGGKGRDPGRGHGKKGIFIPVSIIKRSDGRSAVAAAACRSGRKLTNEWDGQTHDYTRKGGVVHAEIMLPAHAPPEFADRSTLWNSSEQIEKARDSQLGREIEAARYLKELKASGKEITPKEGGARSICWPPRSRWAAST